MAHKGIRTKPPEVRKSHTGQARASARKKQIQAEKLLALQKEAADKGVLPIHIRQAKQKEVDAIKSTTGVAFTAFAKKNDWRPQYGRW